MPRLATFVVLLLIACAPSPAAESFFDSGGVRIHYVAQGEGEPVVLVHGISRSIELTWRATGLLDALSSRYRVIALDCRGHGLSEKPTLAGAYGRHMVEDVARLLDHLDIRRAYIIGYSMGDRIVLKFAATHPERVRGVVLIGAGGARPTDDHALWDRLAASLEGGAGIRPLVLHIQPSDQPPPAEEEIQRINEMVLARNSAEALAEVARQYREFATSEAELARVDVPVLAVVGARDNLRSDVMRLKAMLPAVEVVAIDGADHVSVLEDPRLRTSVERFLAAAGAGATGRASGGNTMKPKLFRVLIPVGDIERATRFYAAVLSMRGTRVSDGRHYFDCDGVILACLDPRADGDGYDATPNPEWVYIAVDDLDGVYEACREAGATFADEEIAGVPAGEIAERPWGERSFYVQDPFGNKVCFVDRATMFTGR